MVIQTRFGTGSVRPNGNKSVSYGLIRTCGTVLRMLGISDLLKGMKSRGVSLDVIVELVCAYQLQGGSSMNECADWLDDDVLKMKLCGGETISQRTIDRSLAVLSDHFEEIIDGIWEGINRIFDIECTDVVVDGSHIPVVGRMNSLSAYGYGGRGIQNQVQFMLGMLRCPTLPFDIMPYPGNMTDQEQYRNFLPRLFKRMTPGSMIVVDNGCAHKDLKKMITDAGMEYLTRERMNLSDDRRIDEHPEDFTYTDTDVCCIVNTFTASGRTLYQFFSVDNYLRGMQIAVKKEAKCAKVIAEGSVVGETPKVRTSDIVKKLNNPYLNVEIKTVVQMIMSPFDPSDKAEAITELMGGRCGYFKLECSIPLPPEKALDIYRARIRIEHLISSIKSVVNIEPLRVWSDGSTNGSLLLALLAQLVVSVVIELMEGIREEVSENGRRSVRVRKPSAIFAVKSLSHLTVSFLYDDQGAESVVYSNFEPMNTEIMGILDRMEACLDPFSGEKWQKRGIFVEERLRR